MEGGVAAEGAGDPARGGQRAADGVGAERAVEALLHVPVHPGAPAVRRVEEGDLRGGHAAVRAVEGGGAQAGAGVRGGVSFSLGLPRIGKKSGKGWVGAHSEPASALDRSYSSDKRKPKCRRESLRYPARLYVQ